MSWVPLQQLPAPCFRVSTSLNILDVSVHSYLSKEQIIVLKEQIIVS